QPAADLFEDLPRPLGVDLVRNLHRATKVRSSRGAGAPKRVAVGVLLASALFAAAILALAFHGLQLLHHVLRPAAQGFERLSLLGDGFLALALAKCAFGTAHGFAGLTETLSGLKTKAFQALLQLLQLLLQLTLL